MRIFYLVILRINTFERHLLLVLFVGHISEKPQHNRSGKLHTRHVFRQSIHVIQMQSPFSVRLKSLIRLCRCSRHEEIRVLCKSIEILIEYCTKTIASSHEDCEHKDTPKYSEGSEQGARFVATQGLPDFRPFVEIKYCHSLEFWRVEHYYLALSAVMGLIFTARRAGKNPAKSPAMMSVSKAEKATLISIVGSRKV